MALADAAQSRCVVDDSGAELCLASPAQRIVALSPSVTELLFAAGAGERVVGVVSFSDYPEAARELPQVGSYDRLDLEALLALEPDLVVAWAGGNPGQQVDRLEAFGLPVFRSDASDFEHIASTLERFGRLAGTQDTGDAAARKLRDSVASLSARYSDSAAGRGLLSGMGETADDRQRRTLDQSRAGTLRRRQSVCQRGAIGASPFTGGGVGGGPGGHHYRRHGQGRFHLAGCLASLATDDRGGARQSVLHQSGPGAAGHAAAGRGNTQAVRPPGDST